MLSTLIATFLVLAASAGDDAAATCQSALRNYDARMIAAANVQQALARMDEQHWTTPEGRVAKLFLFEHQERLAQELRTETVSVRAACREVTGFEQVDTELRKLEPVLRTIEIDSRQMKILLSGGRQA